MTGEWWKKWRTDSRARRRRTCSSTPTTRSTGGSGGPAAFEEARRRNVPVLLSVGYAACHWCHVMAHESFEDEATAAYLNEHFVSIKVDREERPDVDAVYMQATTSMTGHGGWPMTCVLDHDGNPFFAGTYFPDQPRHGQPSFRQVLQALSDAWRQPRRRGRRGWPATLREHLNQQAALAAGRSPTRCWTRAVRTLAGEFDARARRVRRRAEVPAVDGAGVPAGRPRRARRCSARTLEAMARGGIHDQLGRWVRALLRRPRLGGAALREDALRQRAAARACTPSGGPTSASGRAEGIADFLLGELQTPEGGFASALDADSEGAEGTYYVWTPAS